MASIAKLTDPGGIENIEVPVGRITFRDADFPLDRAAVAGLIEALPAHGLLNPVTLRRNGTHGFTLVAGRHRLEAARQLGWETIPARVLPGEAPADAVRTDKLLRISENLHRRALTPLQRATMLKQYLDLTGRTCADAQVSRGRGKKGGVSQIARELRISRREVDRSLAIANITEEAKATAVEVGLDRNQGALLEVAEAPAGEQLVRVREIAAQEAATPQSHDDPATYDDGFADLMHAWEKAGPQARQRFIAEIITPWLERDAAFDDLFGHAQRVNVALGRRTREGRE